jgi:HSP90 family molecular chaperone
VNPRHQVIKNLSTLKESDAELAAMVTQQLTDNALLAAGMMENPQNMVNRMNDLLARIVK